MTTRRCKTQISPLVPVNDWPIGHLALDDRWTCSIPARLLILTTPDRPLLQVSCPAATPSPAQDIPGQHAAASLRFRSSLQKRGASSRTRDSRQPHTHCRFCVSKLSKEFLHVARPALVWQGCQGDCQSGRKRAECVLASTILHQEPLVLIAAQNTSRDSSSTTPVMRELRGSPSGKQWPCCSLAPPWSLVCRPYGTMKTSQTRD